MEVLSLGRPESCFLYSFLEITVYVIALSVQVGDNESHIKIAATWTVLGQKL
jgi:hypothetical protein